MTISSSGVLMDTLRQQDLLTPEQLAELPRLTKSPCGDARSFGKVLIQRGWLSVYQVNQLLAGNTSELVIGPYFVLDKLGQGGLSQVYKARHRESGELVAVKMIKAEVFADAEGRQQFLQEVEAMARLDHENIVQFCDADQWKDTSFRDGVRQKGTDLGKVIRLSGALPVFEAMRLHSPNRARLATCVRAPDTSRHQTGKPLSTEAPCKSNHQAIRSRQRWRARRVPRSRFWTGGLASRAHPQGQNAEINSENLAQHRRHRGLPGARTGSQRATPRTFAAISTARLHVYFLLTGQPPFMDGTLMQRILHHQQSTTNR